MTHKDALFLDAMIDGQIWMSEHDISKCRLVANRYIIYVPFDKEEMEGIFIIPFQEFFSCPPKKKLNACLMFLRVRFS